LLQTFPTELQLRWKCLQQSDAYPGERRVGHPSGSISFHPEKNLQA
jgi:hypothetical protein